MQVCLSILSTGLAPVNAHKDDAMLEKTTLPRWEMLLRTIQKSYAIQRHQEFFMWMQRDVHPLVRHDMLLSAWGNFDTGDLKFDVTSAVPHLTTQRLLEDSAIVNYLMCNFYKRWLKHDEKWFVIDQFDASGMHAQAPGHFTKALSGMHSLLVFGFRDARGKEDCIYVFFDRHARFSPPEQALGMLMPHVDAAMRRIGYLTNHRHEEVLFEHLTQGHLSDREQEILHWVRGGKTNLEIGLILNISTNTVKNHLKRIFQKLDVSCRAQAVAKTGQLPLRVS